MVKGVNKSIIEVNDTNSEIFEKIVFYVSPKFSSLGVKSLEKEIGNIEKSLGLCNDTSPSLRLRVKNKQKRKKILAFSVISMLVVFAIYFLLFKLF